MNDSLLLLLAGLLAGSMNALAGGGSFVSLPALIAAGVPSVSADATSTVAIFPGGVASAWVYRDGLSEVCGVPLVPFAVATLIGGFLGSLLLLWTPSTVFDQILPWLLLIATLTLSFGRRIGPLLRARFRVGLATIIGAQFLLGIYGGYFGGGVGLMMISVWSIIDGADIKTLNPPRTVMVNAANGIAVICFIIAGAVAWKACLLVGAGAMAGGWCGAHLGRRLPAIVIQVGTLLVAFAITIAFFVRAYA